MKKSTKSIVFMLGITTAGFAIYALLEKPRREAPDLKNPTASAVEFSNSNQTDNRLLPPPDSKLRDIIPELKKRANSGDARASCRLAAEYELCRSTKNQVDSLELFIADEQKRETSEAKENANQTIVLLSKALIQDEQHCEAVEIPPAREIISLWRSAALKNHRPSMVTYALGQAFSLNNTMDELDSLLLYRAEAEQMANRAVAAGSAEAVLALARAYSPEGQAPMRSLLAQSVGPDSVKAMSLYLLLRNSSGAM